MTAPVIVTVLAVAWSAAYAALSARSRRDAGLMGALLSVCLWTSLETWRML